LHYFKVVAYPTKGRELSAPPKGKVSSTGRLLKACPTGGQPGSNACGEGGALVETGSLPL